MSTRADDATPLLTPGRCLIIGEVAQAHDGSLGMAHAYVDAIADAGADAVKFQTHIADAESCEDEPWRVRFSPQDEHRIDYWRRMAFSEAQWRGLKTHAQERGLLFLSSPFSVEAVALLERLDMRAFKIASGELSNPQLLDAVLATGKPLLVSSGMSPLAELDAVIARAREAGVEHGVFQCTSAYPCPPEKLGLNLIPALRDRYGCAVGLSDHSGTIFAGLAAATIGIEALEVHVTMSRKMFGPDVTSSVTDDELAQLVEGIRFVERAHAHPLDKDDVAEGLGDLRRTFTKSLVARRDLTAGDVLHDDDLTAKKPGTGLPAAELPRVVGRRLARDVTAGSRLAEADLEPAGDAGDA